MLTKPKEWRIDSERSTLRFSLRHIIVSEIRGSFGRWGGTITHDEVDPTKSIVNVWVDLNSVDTGDQERDRHVCSSEFFDIERFPLATFTSTNVRLDDRSPVVQGALDLHGVTAQVDLEIVEREHTTDPSGIERTTYSISGRLDRREFGLRWNQDLDLGGIVVGDDIRIQAHIESVRSTH